MKASRELDALVAEKVLGWKFRRQPFSSSIADAWQVVEALNARGWLVVIEQSTESSIVHVYRAREDEPCATLLERSAPLAIALASLYAAGFEEHVRALGGDEDLDGPVEDEMERLRRLAGR